HGAADRHVGMPERQRRSAARGEHRGGARDRAALPGRAARPGPARGERLPQRDHEHHRRQLVRRQPAAREQGPPQRTRRGDHGRMDAAQRPRARCELQRRRRRGHRRHRRPARRGAAAPHGEFLGPLRPRANQPDRERDLQRRPPRPARDPRLVHARELLGGNSPVGRVDAVRARREPARRGLSDDPAGANRRPQHARRLAPAVLSGAGAASAPRRVGHAAPAASSGVVVQTVCYRSRNHDRTGRSPMKRISSLAAGTLLLSLALSCAFAQVRPSDGVTLVTSVEGITEYRLDNGLRVLLFPDPSKATITVNVTYLVGSLHEGAGEAGMAHLLEHMLFKGSRNHANILQEMQDRGAQMNGTTSWDRTNYFETFDATDENLAWAIELEADRMVNALIAQADLDSEMTVVRNELEASENNPLGVLQRRLLSTAYIWHGYRDAPIGSRSDIENVSIERLRAFYRKHYQPDNAVLVIAGRIDEARTLALVAERFG